MNFSFGAMTYNYNYIVRDPLMDHRSTIQTGMQLDSESFFDTCSTCNERLCTVDAKKKEKALNNEKH